IAYDIGTTGNKSCLYRLDDGVSLVAAAARRYGLTITEDGGAEQDPEDWWRSMAETTAELLASSRLRPRDIAAVSFCSQMQGLVLVDEAGNALRPAMSYMDKRAAGQFEAWGNGFLPVAGVAIRKLLVSLAETGVAAGSAKDPVFKYAWVRENEPAVFSRIGKWLDVKDFLLLKATGRMVMTEDSAFATMLYNTGRKRWSAPVCALHGVNEHHLPDIIRSTDMAGTLTAEAAARLGLSTGCRVFAGAGDSALIGIGAGSASIGQTHVYIGTSGWVSTVTDRRLVDVSAMIASIVGAEEGKYNYFAEMETSGKCLEWLGGILGLGVEAMCAEAASAPAGSGGVIFMPWLPGNRCPFEDSGCRGGFFNTGLRTGRAELIRSVLEGICLHKRWMLEKQAAKIATSETLRVAGGGARSPLICQILADITGRGIERPRDPQNAGALGAAMLMAAGLGLTESVEQAASRITAEQTFEPDKSTAAVYEKNYRVFTKLYRSNRRHFAALNN
ncbi:MAG: FGGY-family carbohydrate kinase, partial [Treponema sp.]|nr:FGGY-family carbohydrate kinase [Treponema sp.]